MDRIDAGWVDEVLDFWFGDLTYKDWFGGGPELDRAITERYAALHGVVRATADEHLLGNADKALAAVLVLDQFSRQIYRGSAEAFASDAKAVTLATAALARKFDAAVLPARRIFFYLPFEHAEDLALQDRAVALISQLGDETYTRYAIAHRDVIARFGRSLRPLPPPQCRPRPPIDGSGTRLSGPAGIRVLDCPGRSRLPAATGTRP